MDTLMTVIASLGFTTVALICILPLALLVLGIVAKWKVFEKMSEEGWKSLIPIYSDYILFKHVWNVKMFGIFCGCLVAAGMLQEVVANLTGIALMLVTLVRIPVAVAILAIVITFAYRLCKSFGHGAGCTVAYMFAEPITLAILGFGKSEYAGA